MKGPLKQPTNFGGLDMIVQDASNATECNSACSKFATVNKVQGCCSSFAGSRPTCRFYIDVIGGLAVNNAPLRKATICLDPSLTTTTSTTVTTTTSSINPQYACSDLIAKNQTSEHARAPKKTKISTN